MVDSRQVRVAVVLLVILALLALVIRLGEPPDDDPFEDWVELAAADVERIDLSGPEGTLSATREEGGWLLTAPAAARGDDQRLDDLVGLVDRLEVQPPLEDARPADYGLDPPVATLVLTRADGSSVTLAVGAAVPVGWSTYVLVDGQVRVARGDVADTLTRPLATFRDGRLHRFAVSTATSATWSVAGERWSVAQRDGVWHLGDGRLAERGEVELWLGELAAATFESFLDEPVQALGTVAVDHDAGTSTWTWGGPARGGIAVLSPTGQAGTLADDLALVRRPGELLASAVLQIPPHEVATVQLSLDGRSVTFSRAADGWLRDGEPTDASVDGLLAASRLDQGVTWSELGSPRGAFEIRSDRATERMVLGEATPDGGLKARLGSDGGAVVTLTAGTVAILHEHLNPAAPAAP